MIKSRSLASPVGCESLARMVEQLCLVCLQDDLDYVGIDNQIGNSQTVLEVIGEIANTEFGDVAADHFPRDICIGCLNKLIELADFRRQIVDSVKLFESGAEFLTTATSSGYSSDPDDDASEVLDDIITYEADESLTFGEFIENLKKTSCPPSSSVKVRVWETCEICSEKFKSNRQLRYHLESEHGVKEYQQESAQVCASCGKTFKTVNGLKFHELTIHSDARPFSCHSCPKSFALKKDYRAHALVHNKSTKAICDLCKRHFTSKELFRRHFSNVHVRGRHFKCHLCYKSFAMRDTLKSHLASHSQEKLFPCSLCEKSYRWRSDLNKHQKIHTTGHRPYPCSLCEKAYLCTSNLKIHLKEVHHLSREDVKKLKFSK